MIPEPIPMNDRERKRGRRRKTQTPDLDAIRLLINVIDPLTPDEQQRVIRSAFRYLKDRYSVPD